MDSCPVLKRETGKKCEDVYLQAGCKMKRCFIFRVCWIWGTSSNVGISKHIVQLPQSWNLRFWLWLGRNICFTVQPCSACSALTPHHECKCYSNRTHSYCNVYIWRLSLTLSSGMPSLSSSLSQASPMPSLS